MKEVTANGLDLGRNQILDNFSWAKGSSQLYPVLAKTYAFGFGPKLKGGRAKSRTKIPAASTFTGSNAHLPMSDPAPLTHTDYQAFTPN